jgi:hypothetical protein
MPKIEQRVSDRGGPNKKKVLVTVCRATLSQTLGELALALCPLRNFEVRGHKSQQRSDAPGLGLVDTVSREKKVLGPVMKVFWFQW